jgi:hypothetical protein
MRTAVLIPGPPPARLPPRVQLGPAEVENRRWAMEQYICWDASAPAGEPFRRVRNRRNNGWTPTFQHPERRLVEVANGYVMPSNAAILRRWPLTTAPRNVRGAPNGPSREVMFGSQWYRVDEDLIRRIRRQLQERSDEMFSSVVSGYQAATAYATTAGRVVVFVGHGASDPPSHSSVDVAPRYPVVPEIKGHQYLTMTDNFIQYINRSRTSTELSQRDDDDRMIDEYLQSLRSDASFQSIGCKYRRVTNAGPRTDGLQPSDPRYYDLTSCNDVGINAREPDGLMLSRLQRTAEARAIESIRALVRDMELWFVSCSTGADREFSNRLMTFLGLRKLVIAAAPVISKYFRREGARVFICARADRGSRIRVFFEADDIDAGGALWPGAGSNVETAEYEFPPESNPHFFVSIRPEAP